MPKLKSNELSPGPWEKIHNELGVSLPKIDNNPIGYYLERHAENIPDAAALTYFTRSFSYCELNILANQMANALTKLGISEGDVIGMHLPNIPQYVIALVAASKIGATISGISAMLAPAEIAQQIKDANVKVLFSLDTLANAMLPAIEDIPKCLSSVIVAGAEDFLNSKELVLPALENVDCHPYLKFAAAGGPEFEQASVSPDHIAFIQYTGGTTGPAKGALIRARAIMLNAELSQVYRPWRLGVETVASALPLFHIAGTIFLTISLRYGGHFILIPNPRDIDHFCHQMIKHPPTRIGSVPTLYQQIVENPLSAKIDFSNLVFAMTGSAPITGEDRAKVEKLLNSVVLSDSYGMTETGPAIVANPPDKCKPEAVGIPLPGVDIRIVDLDAGTRELPYGEAGEIIVSTPCLMAGYLNRPDETTHAIRQWRGKTWMHTGDVGVMDADGYIYLRDRTKDVINVSGLKVFSNEVENSVSGLESIASSALIGSPDPDRPGSEIVNLYVELTVEAKMRDPDDIRAEILEFCRENLARYKKPKAIHFLAELPLTPVGKIDKKRLRDEAKKS